MVAIAIVAALSAPMVAMASQTPTASTSDDVLAVVPDSALMFVRLNLDTDSDQITLARQLSERAGLGDALSEMTGADGIPENAHVGLIVTSLPDVDEVDVASVQVDPAAATDVLDSGGYAAVISSGSNQAIYDDELAGMQESGEITETEYGGVTITTSTAAASDDFADPQAIAMVGGLVVIAMRAEDIQPIIDAANGDVSGIADNEHYQAVSALLPAEYIANGYIDGPSVLQAAAASSSVDMTTVDPRMTDSLSAWSGFTFAAEEQGFRFETRSIPADGDVAEMTPIDGSFYDKVPADAVFAVNGTNIDSNGALTMLAFLFASEMVGEDVFATPTAEVDLDQAQQSVFAQAEQLFGFNLKTDLIDHLNGEFGVSVSVGNITSDVPEVNAMIVTNVDDPAGVADVMTKVAMIVGAGLGDQTAVQDRDVDGSTVSSVDISETGVASTVDFGVVGDDLVIGIGTGVDDYANGAENPMSADTNFNAVMEQMPTEYGSLTYVNMPVLLDLVMGFSDSISGQMGMTDADPSCGEYATQEEAQAAYDADQFENYQLDQDFDGEACEDFFDATPAATPAAQGNPYENVIGMASVTTQDDGVSGTTTFLMIGGGE